MCKLWEVNIVCRDCKEAVLITKTRVEECGLDRVPLKQDTKKETNPNQVCLACAEKERKKVEKDLGGYQVELNKGKVKQTGSRMCR